MSARSRYDKSLSIATTLTAVAQTLDRSDTVVGRAILYAGARGQLLDLIGALDALVLDCQRAKGMYLNNPLVREGILAAGVELAALRPRFARLAEALREAAVADNPPDPSELQSILRMLAVDVAMVRFVASTRQPVSTLPEDLTI